MSSLLLLQMKASMRKRENEIESEQARGAWAHIFTFCSHFSRIWIENNGMRACTHTSHSLLFNKAPFHSNQISKKIFGCSTYAQAHKWRAKIFCFCMAKAKRTHSQHEEWMCVVQCKERASWDKLLSSFLFRSLPARLSAENQHFLI